MPPRPIDLGVCPGFAWDGDPACAAIGLPGALLGGMPPVGLTLQAAVACGWSAVQVWDQFLDREQDPNAWVLDRLDAAVGTVAAGARLLIVAKSLSTRAASVGADRGVPAIWLTPLLDDEQCVAALGPRTAPALLANLERVVQRADAFLTSLE